MKAESEATQIKQMKERLKKFIDQSFIFDMIPISSNIIAISDEIKIPDFIKILDENLTYKSLIINKKTESVKNIYLVVDLINILIYLKTEKSEILEENEKIEKYLNSLTLAESIAKFGFYKKNKKKDIISMMMNNKVRKALEIFQNERIGNILVKTNSAEKEFFSILTKKDFLLYILRNYRAKINEQTFFEIKIKNLNIDIIRKEKDTLFLPEKMKLAEAFELIKKNEISFMPVLGENKRYRGFINKQVIFFIFKNKLFNFLNKDIKQFLDFVEEKEYFSEGFLGNLFFTMEDSLLDIFRKFVYTRGQIVWVEEGIFKGMISLHEVLNFFILQ